MQFNLCGGKALVNVPRIHVQELLDQLHSRFPEMIVDWEQGKSYVQERLNLLMSMNAPEVVVEAERACLGKVVFVSIREVRWSGATVTSYLSSISPPLGDGVRIEVAGADGTVAVAIAREVTSALGMSLYPPEPE